MFDRISRSFELAKSSWRVLMDNKQLVIFPVFSGIAAVIVLLSFAVPIGVLAANGVAIAPVFDADGNTQVPVWYYPVTFAFYFCNYFVIVFFNSALVSCALMRFNGQQPTIGDGLRAATARLPQILAWALLAATVGVILKAIENSNRRIGYFISMILGTAWTVMTFFVVPVLVVEKTGPFAAIGRSLALLKKTWGEALIGHLGIGFFKFLLVLPGIIVIGAGIYLSVALQPIVLGLAVVGLGVLYLLIAIAVAATLDTIFVTALYQYAAFDKVPDGFDHDTLSMAFQPRPATKGLFS
jgi:hypothetical protein